ncbi:MAG: hypothetical protein LUO89_10595 [Methanothrix sp.]|nr:hypothetical protein [Methanothrix sp.]
MHSKILGQDLELYVKLPWTYAQSDKVYPVLFSLDGNRSFPLYSTMSLIFETPGRTTEEILIAGVGYQLDPDRLRGLAQWAAWRTRDLIPVPDEGTDRYWNKTLSALLGGEDQNVRSGGAPRFLQSLREEIVPFVEANYRISSANRGLAGYSYGGLFVLYTLFHAPEVFTRYFAGSPTMEDYLFEYEEGYASQHTDLEARLFITAGGNESDLLEPVQRMLTRLQSRGYPKLQVLSHVFEGEGHSSAYAASVSRALCMLYGEDWRKH